MSWFAVIVLAVGLLSLGAQISPAEGACNAKSDGAGRCPFRVEGVNVFDRCFGAPPVGDDAPV
jgi:hypothetical protein